jgi:hypothetical protein
MFSRIKYLYNSLKYREEPDYEEIGNLQDLEGCIRYINIDLKKIDIPGWLTENERKALYGLARWLPGPYLEIGPWVGLSTVILSLGIIQSGKSKPFVTAELNPKPDNYRPYNGGVGFFVPPGSEVPCGICSEKLYEESIKPVINSPDGVIGELKRNLKRNSLDKVVTIFEGDFIYAPNLGYRLIFSDAMHDENEIKNNSKYLLRFVTDGMILACHDIFPNNLDFLLRCFDFSTYIRVDSLFIGMVGKDRT